MIHCSPAKSALVICIGTHLRLSPSFSFSPLPPTSLLFPTPFPRLSEQAQRHLQEGEKFEDILLGMSRPTMVVQRYQELYSQERVEALDAIEGAEGVTIGKEWGMGSAGKRNFGMRLMLDVLKVCHSVCVWGGGGVCACKCTTLSTHVNLPTLTPHPQFACSVSCSSLEKLHREWKSSLGVNGIQDKVAVKQLESAVGLFLRRVCATHDISTIIKVCPDSAGNKETFNVMK